MYVKFPNNNSQTKKKESAPAVYHKPGSPHLFCILVRVTVTPKPVHC